MLHTAILSYAASLALPHFSTLSHKRYNFRGKKLFNIKCVFRFSLQYFFETFLVIGKIQPDTVINMKMSSCKVPVILVGFQQKLNFWKNSNIKFHKNPTSGSRIFLYGQTNRWTDRSTDMKMLIDAFRNFANAPNNRRDRGTNYNFFSVDVGIYR
jgi:hypothetical protein